MTDSPEVRALLALMVGYQDRATWQVKRLTGREREVSAHAGRRLAERCEERPSEGAASLIGPFASLNGSGELGRRTIEVESAYRERCR